MEKQQNEIMKNKFYYQGYAFIPFKKIGEHGFDFYASRIYTDIKMGMANYSFPWEKHSYDYEEFYDASFGSQADVFLCINNGNFYIPGSHELFGFLMDPDVIPMNKYILNVIESVLAYRNFVLAQNHMAESQNINVYDITKKYYYGLELPFGMERNNSDFDRILSYSSSKDEELAQLNNTEFCELHHYIWKEKDD